MVLSNVPPTIELHAAAQRVRAEAIELDGQQACLRLAAPPQHHEGVSLRLGWSDGTVTRLTGRVRHYDEEAAVARLDVLGVSGAWEPFLRYLGGRA